MRPLMGMICRIFFFWVWVNWDRNGRGQGMGVGGYDDEYMNAGATEEGSEEGCEEGCEEGAMDDERIRKLADDIWNRCLSGGKR